MHSRPLMPKGGVRRFPDRSGPTLGDIPGNQTRKKKAKPRRASPGDHGIAKSPGEHRKSNHQPAVCYFGRAHRRIRVPRAENADRRPGGGPRGCPFLAGYRIRRRWPRRSSGRSHFRDWFRASHNNGFLAGWTKTGAIRARRSAGKQRRSRPPQMKRRQRMVENERKFAADFDAKSTVRELQVAISLPRAEYTFAPFPARGQIYGTRRGGAGFRRGCRTDRPGGKKIFLSKLARRKKTRTGSEPALDAICMAEWPGNVGCIRPEKKGAAGKGGKLGTAAGEKRSRDESWPVCASGTPRVGTSVHRKKKTAGKTPPPRIRPPRATGSRSYCHPTAPAVGVG